MNSSFYNKSVDQEIKGLVIDTFGQNTARSKRWRKIALFDPSAEYSRQALERLKWLKENSDKLRNDFHQMLQDQLQ